MKTCFKCAVEKEETEFYSHPQMGDGLLGKCKDCTKRDVRENRQKRLDHYRTFDRERANIPHRAAAREAYTRTEAGRASQRRSAAKWAELHPQETAAQQAFHNRKRYDPALATQPCEVCGARELVHAHHENYNHVFRVRWLCPKHHSERHIEMRAEGLRPHYSSRAELPAGQAGSF